MSRTRLRYFAAAALLLMLVSMLAACGATSSAGATSTKKFKVGLVTDIGGLNDRGLNHPADVGLEKAKTDLAIQGDAKESQSADEYVPNLTSLGSQRYDL